MNQQNKTYKVLGLMSGTSFDGIDLCISEFYQLKGAWKFNILKAETIPYSSQWKQSILACEEGSGEELIFLDFQYGHFLGQLINTFLEGFPQQIDLIASHGHTIFHQTHRGFTFQLGNGAAIAASTGIPTVSDFRSLDVALGGEGAPLVPLGDEKLFPHYAACLNIGGIANISFHHEKERIAFDIVPANMVLNRLYQEEYQKDYDHEGRIASKGRFHQPLFEALNALAYYHQKAPKSLGKEWVVQQLYPLLSTYEIPTEDKLHTYTRHIAHQIAAVFRDYQINGNNLISGGGSHHLFLLQCLREKGLQFEVAEKQLNDFKEALIFGFLGLLRFLEKTNTYQSVTGASKNSMGGSIFLP